MTTHPPAFIPGQRWLSETEPDLGLGCVTQVEFRLVRLDFPACGESRTYSRQNAPLARIRFSEGDTVEDRQGRKAKVIAIREEAGLLSYRVTTENGNEWDLPEAKLSDRFQFNRPQDRLLAGRIDDNPWFGLRYQTWLKRAELLASPVFGLTGPRVGLIPHQLHIAAEVASRHAPRVLLADEVGLGKTIEAGLILHRMWLTGRVRRVLLVVPEALLHQWLVEMLRRFNLLFALFNQERFTSLEGENPFLTEQRVLCSLEFLTATPKVARAVLAGGWDLLVVDEAHHLTWSEGGSSLEYDLIEALAEHAKGVLLLTATPEQLGRSGHFGRLRLLDPARFHDYEAFLQEEEQYAPVASIAAKLLDDAPLDGDEQALLASLLGKLEGDPTGLVDRLVDRHGTGRVLFRNTRAAIKGFPGRRLLEYPLPLPTEYTGLPCGLLGWHPETLHGPGWTRIDGRVAWLAGLLRQLAPEKVLLICAHPGTVLELREMLLAETGIRASVFHEGMEIVERDRAAAYFADPEEGAQLLICSEIGSEGRNFQFAHHLILFDLPLEPELLEQRIGRLDRIGQTQEIQIHVPYFQGSPSEALLRWYRDGLDAFLAVAPAAPGVYDQLHEELHGALSGVGDIDPLIEKAARLSRQIGAELETGRDRLLELQSHHPERAAQLVDEVQAWDQAPDLADYLSRYWDSYGVNHEPGPGRSTVLHPGSHMLHETFPCLPGDGATLTFDRADALAHEDREFITWEHPMTQGAMDALVSSELGSAAFILARDPAFKTGTLLLELIHVVECVAPAELEVGRFLPPTPLRLLLDAEGNNLADRIPHQRLQGQCLTRNRKLAETLIRSQTNLLRGLIEQGGNLAHQEAQGLVADALNRMERELESEHSRLTALAALNPNVRQDEIEYLETLREQLGLHLRHTPVRLDALRILVFA
ncbi:MAG: RNA polymerase-binding ATPase [Gammaproteobacteria bacterium RIFOXYD12_FULL_61_37]|nr:MAG: RNA polymerase-binding ATPase [Gammaproteobacteria bacterium RIFOXYD12_FULL_61_37]